MSEQAESRWSGFYKVCLLLAGVVLPAVSVSVEVTTDCFQGVGYEVSPLPMRVDEAGARWSCFAATRGEERLRVCERIYDETGRSWTDVSAWYWAAAMGTQTRAPWWAVTEAKAEG